MNRLIDIKFYSQIFITMNPKKYTESFKITNTFFTNKHFMETYWILSH